MYKLKRKAIFLHDRNETKAYNAAIKLHDRLNELFHAYLLKDNKVDAFNNFKREWDAAIEEQSPELEKHRGWTNFLANLVLCISTLGIAHTVAAFGKQITGRKYTDDHGLFPLIKTDSAEQVDRLNEGIGKIAPNKPK